MNYQIQLARKGSAKDCLACVQDSPLWDNYFQSDSEGEQNIEEMIAHRQIRVALNDARDIIGFIGVMHHGCFRKFSYLALIAVKNEYRGKGVGTALIAKFEEVGFLKADRVFMLVSGFNQRAHALYRKLGYAKVGEIPDLFKPGVSEQVLIKYKE